MFNNASGGLETLQKPPITIDSYKIRILSKYVRKAPEIFNCISERIITNRNTGEVIETSEPEELKKDFFSNDNYTTQFEGGLEIQVTGNNESGGKVTEEFYTFKITSKLLKENYFNGIDNNTFKQIYDYIKSVGYEIEFKDFLKSELTDIDYKFDLILAPEVYKSIAKQYNLNAIEWKELYKGLDNYNQKTNQGVSFGIRERATPSYPFMKVYNKELESKNKSFNFFNVYSTIIDNQYRWEFTIKNKKHFDYLGLNNTLEFHLQLVEENQNKLWEIFKIYHNIHLNNFTSNLELTKKKEYTNMNDIILSALVEKLINENDFGIKSIISYFNFLLDNQNISRTSKYRIINKVEEIYNDFKNSAGGKSKIEINETTENVFKLIGIM